MVPAEELFADHYNGHRRTSPAANDHPTTTSRPSRRSAHRCSAGSTRRRDQRVPQRRVNDSMNRRSDTATNLGAVQGSAGQPAGPTRPHRALGQLAPAQADTRPPEINLAEHRIRRKHVLGGLTHEYQIAA